MIELVAALTLLGADTEGDDYWTQYKVQYETRAECVENANALVSEFVVAGFTFNITGTLKSLEVTLEKGDTSLSVFCKEVEDVAT
jgi:hypothetical protein